MTSMIDVVFLLLIFFMVTSSYSAEEDRLAAGLGAEGRGERAQDFRPQIVWVRARGSGVEFHMGERVIRDQPSLTALLRDLPREPGVVVRAEPGAPVSAVLTAMQAASDAGFRKRSYVPATR